jgi:hypothetical protein
VLLLLLPLATHRVTRFITRDKFPIVMIPREAFIRRWGVYNDASNRTISIGGHRTNVVMASLAYLWECDWCTSAWVAAGLTVLLWRYPATMTWVLAAMAASDVTGLITTAEPGES